MQREASSAHKTEQTLLLQSISTLQDTTQVVLLYNTPLITQNNGGKQEG